MPARIAQHLRDRASEQLEITRVIDDAAANEREIVVIGRHAFEGPELARVAFAREVVRHERRGLDPLYVPAVKIFVARKAEQIEIAVVDLAAAAQWQFVAATNEARARPVLEATVAITDGGDLEQVAIERRTTVRCAAKKIDLPLANAREIAREPLEIRVLLAGNRDLVPHFARGERREREVTHLDRVIDELVVVARAIDAEPVRTRSR